MEIKLKPFQDAFMFSRARYCSLLAGIGVGKSMCGLIKMYNFCSQNPNSMALLLRHTQTDAMGSTLLQFKDLFGKEFNSDNRYNFSNGSSIIARHIGDTAGLTNYNINFILVEEAHELDEKVFPLLVGRLRRATSDYRQIALLSNARGPNWIYKKFIESAAKINVLDEETGQKEYFSENGEYHCITANTYSCADIHQPDFIESLRNLEKSEPNYYKANVLNDFTALGVDDAVFSYGELLECKNKFIVRPGYGMRIAGLDVARFGDDSSAFIVLEQMDYLKWQLVHVEEWKNSDLATSTGRVSSLVKQWEVSHVIIDEDGIGGGILDNLSCGQRNGNYEGFRNLTIPSEKNSDFANYRTVAAFDLQTRVKNNTICIPDEKTIQELCTLRYTYQPDGRRILLSKIQMRKQGVKSPNLADALLMVTTLIDNVAEEQSARFYPSRNQPNCAPDCDLYENAGII